jgi:hypothetical protein
MGRRKKMEQEVENELSYLMEITLYLEDELNKINLKEN